MCDMWGTFFLTVTKKCGLIERWGIFKNLIGIPFNFFRQIFLQMFSLLVPAVITQPPLEPFINYAQGGISPETSSILDFIRDANYSVSNLLSLTTFGFSPIVMPWWMHQTIRIYSHLHFFFIPIFQKRKSKMPQFPISGLLNCHFSTGKKT